MNYADYGDPYDSHILLVGKRYEQFVVAILSQAVKDAKKEIKEYERMKDKEQGKRFKELAIKKFRVFCYTSHWVSMSGVDPQVFFHSFLKDLK